MTYQLANMKNKKILTDKIEIISKVTELSKEKIEEL